MLTHSRCLPSSTILTSENPNHSFLHDASNILHDSYLPDSTAISNLEILPPGLPEVYLDCQYLFKIKLSCFELNTRRMQQARFGWCGFLYLVDLDCYDRIVLDEHGRPINELMKAMADFDKAVNRILGTPPVVFLALNNMERFSSMIEEKPLGDYFFDYHGPNDKSSTGKYIEERFRGICRDYYNRYQDEFYVYFIDRDSELSIQFFASALAGVLVSSHIIFGF